MTHFKHLPSLGGVCVCRNGSLGAFLQRLGSMTWQRALPNVCVVGAGGPLSAAFRVAPDSWTDLCALEMWPGRHRQGSREVMYPAKFHSCANSFHLVSVVPLSPKAVRVSVLLGFSVLYGCRFLFL